MKARWRRKVVRRRKVRRRSVRRRRKVRRRGKARRRRKVVHRSVGGAGDAGGDTLRDTPYLEVVEGRLEVLEMQRCGGWVLFAGGAIVWRVGSVC